MIDGFATVAGEFRTICKDYALRPATRQRIARSIEASRGRMVAWFEASGSIEYCA